MANETRNEIVQLKQHQDDVDKTISMLKEKLEVETRAAEKRRQLLSLLGPKSKENQEKVIIICNNSNQCILHLQSSYVS